MQKQGFENEGKTAAQLSKKRKAADFQSNLTP